MDKKESAETIVEFAIQQFNDNLEVIESFGFGANFEWYYTEQGKKRLKLRTFAPIEKLPEDKLARLIDETQSKVVAALGIPPEMIEGETKPGVAAQVEQAHRNFQEFMKK